MLTVDTERKMLPMGTHAYVIGSTVGFLLSGVTGLAVGALVVAGLMYLLNIILYFAD